MCAHVKESIEIPSLGNRRYSTNHSTGLDYSTCCHVEDDLLSRIRSLLLSRHFHHPPRTPYSSDEESWVSRNRNTVTSFDFSSAKSVAKRAHWDASRLSLPNPRISGSSSSQPTMVVQTAVVVPIRAESKLKKPVVIQHSSSADDLSTVKLREATEATESVGRVFDDKTIHDILLTCCPPCPSAQEKNSFIIPRLRLLPKEHTRLQYDLSSIAPRITSLKLRIRDIEGHSAKLVPPKNDHSVEEDVEGCRRVTAQNIEETSSHKGSADMVRPTILAQNGYQTELVISTEAHVVQPAQRTPSFHTRPYSPSLQSGASRASSQRHALLKTSAISSELLDLGLPVQPVLTLPSHAESPRLQRHSPNDLDTPRKRLTDALQGRSDSIAKGATNYVSPKEDLRTKTPLATRPVVYTVDPFAPSSDESYHGHESLEDAARIAAEYLSRPFPWHSSSGSCFRETDTSFEHQFVDGKESSTERKSVRGPHAFFRRESGEYSLNQRPVGKEVAHKEHQRGTYGKHETESTPAHEAFCRSRTGSSLTDREILPPCHPGLSHIPTRFSSYERIVDPSETYEQLADRLESPYLEGQQARDADPAKSITRLSTSSASDERISDVSETCIQLAECLESPRLIANGRLILGSGHPCHEKEVSAVSSKWNSNSSWKRFKRKQKSGQQEVGGRDAKSIEMGKEPKEPFKDRVAKQLSIDQLSRKTIHKLRFVSSMNSTRNESTHEHRHGLLKSQNSRLLPKSPLLNGVDQVKAMLHDKLRRSQAVYSSQGLGTDGEGYTTQFTSFPARAHDLKIKPSTFLAGSSKSDGELDHGNSPERQDRVASAQITEAFTQTIEDIEHLLNEALFIAHQAAESQNVNQLRGLLQDVTAVPKTGCREKSDEKTNWHRFKRGYLKHMFQPHHSEDPLSLRSCHASKGTLSSEAASTQSVIEFDMNHEISDQLNDIASNMSRNGSLVSPALLAAEIAGQGENRAEPSSTPIPNCLKTSMKVTTPLEPVETLHNAKAVNGAPENGTSGSVETKMSKHSRLPSIRHSNADPASLEPPEHAIPFAALPPRKPGRDRTGTLFSKEDRGASRDLKRKGVLPHEKEVSQVVRDHYPPGPLVRKQEVNEPKRVFHPPSIEPRGSSLMMRKSAKHHEPDGITSAVDFASMNRDPERATLHSLQSLDGSLPSDQEAEFYSPPDGHKLTGLGRKGDDADRHELRDVSDTNLPRRHISGRNMHSPFHDRFHLFDLRGHSHVSLKGAHSHGFSLSRSHKRQPVARDWSPFRKRFVATVACISTALIGIIVGIYAGEVPSIQYYIADFDHFAILGNVFFYVGIAIPTMVFWPLPLLHGRKPYILASMSIAMPLLFPQAIVISVQRSPYVSTFRLGLLLPRAFMGFVLGFANMNFLAILTDLFGASLQSGNPHQEVVDEYDVRRHGGGLGVWLGIWTWCYMGSIGVGFMIGACIINTYSPDWGLYISIIIIAAVLVLNVITPEVRRSAYRRSVTEVRTDTEISRRLARGEVKMHRVQTGPTWWGEEFHHGVQLSLGMVRQPGFLIMALYVAWIYGQIVLVIVLLGSLMSKVYHLQSPYVGAATCAIPIGAFLAIPFQKASLFSRARHHPQRTDSMTFQERVSWSSHLVRRAIFTLVLPFATLAYTLSSTGPPIPFIIPVMFAGLIGFLSNIAIAECNGIIMEAFDTSDLQPGLTGRQRGASGDRSKDKRTNYSSFPRVSSAFAITQGLGFLIAAAATGVGGVAQRNLGQQAATGVMAGILLILTILLLGVLIRWKEVQIIPVARKVDMDRWNEIRKSTADRRRSEKTNIGQSSMSTSVQLEEEPWRPTIIGNPSGKTRRMSVLELGSLSRWSEIRRKNRLIDDGLEARHPNLATLGSARDRLREVNIGLIDTMKEKGKLRRDGSHGTALSEDSTVAESEGNGDLGERRWKARQVAGVANGKLKEKTAD